MVDSADRYIAENRRDIRRTEANFIEAPDAGSISLVFGRNVVEVEVTGEVYKRDLNDSLVVGHPNGADHGIGTGAIGDQRGGWTLVASDEDSGELVRDGRGAIRDSLDGQTGGVREVGVGTGTTAADTGDRTLVSLSTKTNGATDKPAPKAAGAMGVFRFHEHENEATEFGVYDTDGSLIARLTFSGVNPTAEEEVRVLVSLTVSASGVGDSVFTDDGEIAVADSLNFPKQVVGLNEIAFGTGSTAFTKSSTGLTSEVIRKVVIRNLELEAIRARAKLYESEPATQPVDLSEMAVFDNSSTPRMLWATTFSPEEKTDGVPLTGTVGFRVE